jgi:hypothetical protein
MEESSKLPVKKLDGTVLEANVVPKKKKLQKVEESEEEEGNFFGLTSLFTLPTFLLFYLPSFT